LPSGGSVTFLDTPGHEAFTAMRGRGAKVTDIVVLVVAADDGVMPQTIEAINHAKAAGVPIIVAVNKMDKEGINPDKVINQLSEHGLVPEDWGGDTLVVKLSAMTGQGVDELLETLHLQAEVLELTANPDRPALGAIIESKVDKGRGPVLTVLVQNGTLRKGDTFVAGAIHGRVRALIADDGRAIEEAGPSIPVEVIGASSTAEAGDDFTVTLNEAQSKFIAEEREQRKRKKELALASVSAGMGMPLTMERFSEIVTTSAEKKDLPLIVKVDVQGSLDAVVGSLMNLSNDEIQVKVIHKGVGAVSENDTQLALASNAIIVAFNVRPDNRALHIIETEGIPTLQSRVIYEIVDAVKDALHGRMAPKFQEKLLGRVEVRQTFRVPRQGTVAGSYVLDGTIARNAQVRLLRDGVIVHEGKMSSLKRFKDDVREVQAGYECGIAIEGYSDIKDGDIIEVFKVEEVKQPFIN
ncbi:MAG TPA: translation initiation factor IF-2, partial [Oligoflexia bacterium]|nr:translation initiation factor IF-2 [Oligoflexia bacterium]